MRPPSPPPSPPSSLPPVNLLLDLPEELLLECVRIMLLNDVPSVLRLCQTSRYIRKLLSAPRRDAEARRLRWEQELTVEHDIDESDGRTLTRRFHNVATPWAACRALPTAGGTSAWTVRLDVQKENLGHMAIGVCDLAGLCAWGLSPSNGRLWRRSRDADGKYLNNVPPPAGWPCGQRLQVMVDEAGKPANLEGRADGATIEVIVDHDEGSLSYRVDGGKVLTALRGFPKGAALRPFAMLASLNDSVTLGGWA